MPNHPDSPRTPSAPVVATDRGGLAIGSVINGKYRVDAYIGEGGVGLVAAAQNLELDERVALKFLRPEMLERPEVVARFLHEAKAACSIKSEYVANVYDVGTMQDGSPFLVMEYLEGQDLGRVIEERGHLGHRDATEYMMQTCEALAVAHARGIVHRDIKPDNLFLTSRAGMSMIKVLDFGISKAALTGSVFGSALPSVDAVSLLGTPLYMSPEQIRDAEHVDSRSDIWSLGIVLYETLTGRHPVDAETLTELYERILDAPLTPISQYRNDLPDGYAAIVDRCLEKDPEQRFQNVAELAIAMMPFAPKRARMCAERAAQALRAAGLIEEWSVRFDSTIPRSSESLPSATPSGTTRSSFRVRVPQESAPPSLRSLALPEPEPPPPDPAQDSTPPSRRRYYLGAFALAAAAGLAGVGLNLRGRESVRPPPLPPPVAASPVTTAAPSGATAAPAGEEIFVDVSASPAGAKLFLDGRPLASNPSRMRVSRMATAHELRAEAEGFEPRMMMIAFDRDRVVDIALAPKKRTAFGGPWPPRTTTTTAGGPPSTTTTAPPPPATTATASTTAGITELDPSKAKPTKHEPIDTDVFKK